MPLFGIYVIKNTTLLLGTTLKRSFSLFMHKVHEVNKHGWGTSNCKGEKHNCR
jgi:hypothetical protein